MKRKFKNVQRVPNIRKPPQMKKQKYLVVMGLFTAMSAATFFTCAIISASVSKHSSTRPMRCASVPLKVRAV